MDSNAQLILAGVSLGNPEDIPKRTLKAVKDCDLLIVEEDKPARQVLKAAQVHREYFKHNEHDDKKTLETVTTALTKGETVCYISDQGLPNIEDPGARLCQIAYQLGARVSVIPGPTSPTAALAACPFPTSPFSFVGFLPQKTTEREQAIKKLNSQPSCTVLLDTPYRLEKVVLECAKHMPKRFALLAVDISGAQEQFIAGRLPEIAKQLRTNKAPFVLVLAPTSFRD